jgi:hypothetical protein
VSAPPLLPSAPPLLLPELPPLPPSSLASPPADEPLQPSAEAPRSTLTSPSVEIDVVPRESKGRRWRFRVVIRRLTGPPVASDPHRAACEKSCEQSTPAPRFLERAAAT